MKILQFIEISLHFGFGLGFKDLEQRKFSLTLDGQRVNNKVWIDANKKKVPT
jgi:hypothetical protein